MILARSRPLIFALLPLALSSSGCGKEACFHWTELEGACPSREEATVFFENPACLSSIASIDSDAEFDGELCCYDVTTIDTGDEVCSAVDGPRPVGGGGMPVPSKPPPPVP